MGGVFLTDRIVVNWGTVDQVKCEIKLFRRAYNDGYDYYHLLSGCDLLIKPIAEFISLVESHQGKEFFSVDYDARNRQNARDKINYYYLFLNKYRETSHCARLSRLLGRITILIQRLLGVNRCRYDDFEYFKGHNWMSLTNAAVSYILSKEEWINNRSRFTSCPYEIYKQTLLMNSNFATSRFCTSCHQSIVKFKTDRLGTRRTIYMAYV